jgi:hypothetical protein
MQKKSSQFILIFISSILIVLITIIVIFFQKKENSQTNQIQKPDSIKHTTNDKEKNLITKDKLDIPEIGFSFELSERYPIVSTQIDSSTKESFPLINSARGIYTGKSLKGSLSGSPLFYFAGITPNYSVERGLDAGEIRYLEYVETHYEEYGWKFNTKGSKYIYKKETGVINDYEALDESDTTYLAIFPLKEGNEFEVVSFYAVNVQEEDFLEIIESVLIY